MKIKAYDAYRKSFPYYKVLYWDANVMAWHDIQKRFAFPEEALDYGRHLGKAFRVMEIDREGRRIYAG